MHAAADQHESPVAIVTAGAGGGIGHGITEVLARAGWAVLIVDRDAQAGEALVERLRADGATAQLLAVDITADDAPQRIVDTALQWRGRVDGLVNNAGTNSPKPIAEMDDADFDAIANLNVRAAYRLARAAAPALTESGGAIVNLSSIHAHTPFAHFTAYAASKGAIEALTRGLATELGPAGVRANCIVPGLVDGAQTRRVMAEQVPDVQQWIDEFASQRQCVPRVPAPADVGELALFLLSARSRSITGQCIAIDGGASVVL